jgi:hypothetical protein
MKELSRKKLQQLCKELGRIKANIKTSVLIEELQAYTADTEPDQGTEPTEQEAATEKEAEEQTVKEAADANAEAEAEIQAQMEAMAGPGKNPVQVFSTLPDLHWEFLRLWKHSGLLSSRPKRELVLCIQCMLLMYCRRKEAEMPCSFVFVFPYGLPYNCSSYWT